MNNTPDNSAEQSAAKPHNVLKEGFKLYLRAILAGMFIGLAGFIFLCIQNTVIGSLLFAVGLLTILIMELPLFTGKVGYLFHDSSLTLVQLIVIWFGNLTGTGILAAIVAPTSAYSKVQERLAVSVPNTLAGTWYSTLLLAVLCGIFMYMAVESFKLTKDMRGAVVTIMCVMGFILTGSLHSIANMFYMNACDSAHLISFTHFEIKPFVWILIMTLGNAIGSQLVSFLQLKKKTPAATTSSR